MLPVMPATYGSAAPLLTAAEEVDLAQQIEAGHEARIRMDQSRARPGDHQMIKRARAARNRFIEANIRLVISIATKIKTPGHVELDDLIQDGIVGLDRAVTKFDWRRGYKFSTYATWWIRQAIQRGLENTASTVRIPAHRSTELRVALAQSGGDTAALPPSLASVSALSTLDSLDRPVGDAESTLGDLAPDDDIDPESAIDALADEYAVHHLLEQMDPDTAGMVIARFGLDGNEPATFSEIAADLGVTSEAIRRRINRALGRLRPAAERLTSPHPIRSHDPCVAA